MNPEHYNAYGIHVGAHSQDQPSTPDEPQPPHGNGTIYFDASSTGWENADTIYFYIYEIGGNPLLPWGSNHLRGIKEEDDIWSFDAGSIGVVDGKEYGIILCNGNTLAETFPLLLNSSCFGDTICADPSVMIENPLDSNKKSMEARWKSSSLGPILTITSIGNLVGESIPSNTTPYQMLVNFLASSGIDGLQNALRYNGLSAQDTIDRIASMLGLTKGDVQTAIREAADTGNPQTGDKRDWSGSWKADKSTLSDGYKITGTVTRYLSEDDAASIKLINSSGIAIKERSLSSKDSSYEFSNVAAGKYTLRVSKKDHVTRDYKITISSGNKTQNVTICPMGDGDGNGKVQAAGAMKAYKHAQGKADAQLSGYAFNCADVAPVGNPNGKVQAADAMIIYQQAQGKHSLF